MPLKVDVETVAYNVAHWAHFVRNNSNEIFGFYAKNNLRNEILSEPIILLT